MAQIEISLHPRPPAPIRDEIVRLAELLTPRWLTPNVPGDTRRDLRFQDALCLYVDGALAGFLVFTGLDGALQITLMGVHPAARGHGYGSRLMDSFLDHARSLGYERVVAMTVPPEANPAYRETLAFYQKHGFVITKRYRELWENGAIELVKMLDYGITSKCTAPDSTE